MPRKKPLSDAARFSGVITVLARLHRVADELRSGSWITTRQITSSEEISAKTVLRMMAFFRHSLSWEIESGQQGYRLIKEGIALIQISK